MRNVFPQVISICEEGIFIFGGVVSFSGAGGTGIGSGSHEAAENAVTTAAAVGIFTNELTDHDRVDAAIHAAANVLVIAFFALLIKV